MATKNEVVIRAGRDKYRTEVTAGGQTLIADEPVEVGGAGGAPTPYDLLLGAIGSCTAMTVRMYADRKGWPLERVTIRLRTAENHAKGWTLEQAMQYARENSSQSETNIQAEVERFAAIPGQALAYKMGQMKITELRRRAEAALGPRFDVKAFHRAILQDGALPLDVLDAKIDRWIQAQQRG